MSEERVAVVLSSDIPRCACGEPLMFETDGNGRVLDICPVCDWGWRHSRDYAAYHKRAEAVVALPDTFSTPAKERVYPNRDCDICGQSYKPSNSRQRYCSNPCKQVGLAEVARARRAREARIRDLWKSGKLKEVAA